MLMKLLMLHRYEIQHVCSYCRANCLCHMSGPPFSTSSHVCMPGTCSLPCFYLLCNKLRRVSRRGTRWLLWHEKLIGTGKGGSQRVALMDLSLSTSTPRRLYPRRHSGQAVSSQMSSVRPAPSAFILCHA